MQACEGKAAGEGWVRTPVVVRTSFRCHQGIVGVVYLCAGFVWRMHIQLLDSLVVAFEEGWDGYCIWCIIPTYMQGLSDAARPQKRQDT